MTRPFDFTRSKIELFWDMKTIHKLATRKPSPPQALIGNIVPLKWPCSRYYSARADDQGSPYQHRAGSWGVSGCSSCAWSCDTRYSARAEGQGFPWKGKFRLNAFRSMVSSHKLSKMDYGSSNKFDILFNAIINTFLGEYRSKWSFCRELILA